MRVAGLAALVLLAACASAPPPKPAADTAAMVGAIRASAGGADDELTVQPLRDATVEDLRQQAATLEAQRRHAEAAAALDRALAITPDDPAVLQERAEVAVLLGEFDQAERLALQAHAAGAKVGPLCRRHWATVEQVRAQRADAAGVASARTQRDACTVGAPARY